MCRVSQIVLSFCLIIGCKTVDQIESQESLESTKIDKSLGYLALSVSNCRLSDPLAEFHDGYRFTLKIKDLMKEKSIVKSAHLKKTYPEFLQDRKLDQHGLIQQCLDSVAAWGHGWTPRQKNVLTRTVVFALPEGDYAIADIRSGFAGAKYRDRFISGGGHIQLVKKDINFSVSKGQTTYLGNFLAVNAIRTIDGGSLRMVLYNDTPIDRTNARKSLAHLGLKLNVKVN